MNAFMKRLLGWENHNNLEFTELIERIGLLTEAN